MKQTTTMTKTKPRDRAKAIEGDVHEIFRDRNMSVEERAERGLAMLAQTFAEDITAQHDHICTLDGTKHKSAVDAEMCRLLRMLEKRKKMFDKLEAAMVGEG